MAYDDFDDTLEPERKTGPRFPTIKLREPGQVWVGMLIDYDPEAPLYVFDSQERKLKPDGRPQTKDVLTVLLLDGTNCWVTLPREDPEKDSEEIKATIGMVARVHIQGHNRWEQGRDSSFRQAKTKNGFRQFHLGDVVRGHFDEETKIGVGGRRLTQPKKIHSFGMRKPRPEEASLVERCRDERHKIKAGEPQPETVPAGATTASPPSNEPEPW